MKLYKAKFPNNEVIKSKAETLVTENEAFNASPLRKDWVELFLSKDMVPSDAKVKLSREIAAIGST